MSFSPYIKEPLSVYLVYQLISKVLDMGPLRPFLHSHSLFSHRSVSLFQFEEKLLV